VRGLPAATLDPANSATPLDYFDKLKSAEVTASGKAKDQFHFTYPTPEWIALSESGISYGYGFQVALVDDTAPDRVAIVAYVEPGTPATAAGIARGTEILEVDGAVVADGTASVLNAGLFPKSAGPHTFVVRDVGASTTRTVTLTAQLLASTPVLKVATLPAPNQKVGYILFNDHIATSEAQLVAANRVAQGRAVTDLVLDIRYNGGGYLDIAAELAYMIAGPRTTRSASSSSASTTTTAIRSASRSPSGPPTS
jgi:C-terminal processing protease CtpA/Prc